MSERKIKRHKVYLDKKTSIPLTANELFKIHRDIIVRIILEEFTFVDLANLEKAGPDGRKFVSGQQLWEKLYNRDYPKEYYFLYDKETHNMKEIYNYVLVKASWRIYISGSKWKRMYEFMKKKRLRNGDISTYKKLHKLKDTYPRLLWQSINVIWSQDDRVWRSPEGYDTTDVDFYQDKQDYTKLYIVPVWKEKDATTPYVAMQIIPVSLKERSIEMYIPTMEPRWGFVEPVVVPFPCSMKFIASATGDTRAFLSSYNPFLTIIIDQSMDNQSEAFLVHVVNDTIDDDYLVS